MTIPRWLNYSIKILQKVDIPTAQLDVELLLADYLGKDRSWLHTHPDFILQRSDLRKLNKQIERRANHEPIAYIRGKQEFYGRDFEVSPDTLTPRPETETMVEMALELMKNNSIQSVADIGTGSGCIAISLDLESKTGAEIAGYEISKPAVEIAKKNVATLGSKVRIVENDIINDSMPWRTAELIVANLPYVPTDFKINTAATHEPEFAIFGGTDGLDYYRIFFESLGEKVRFVLTESLPPQHIELQKIAESAGFKLKESRDLIQSFTRN